MSARYKIDTVSNLYPAVGGHVYRLCAVFKEPVNTELLHEAVKSLASGFPIMCSHLQRTFYSYVHTEATDWDIIDVGDPYIYLPDMVDTEKPSFRLHAKGCLVSMDIFHGNGDGRAGANFLNALIINYCRLLDGEPLPEPVLPKDEDLKDPYPMYYKPAKATSFSEKTSYHIRLEKPEKPYVRCSCIGIDRTALKAITKPMGITVNDFLCAMLYSAIVRHTDAKDSALPVTISVPIDLRPFFGSHSQRNFAFYTNIRILRKDAPDMESTAKYIHEQVRKAMQKENLLGGIAAAHKAANNAFVRIVPRAVKEFFIRKAYRHVAGGGITTSFSNIGYQNLPPEAQNHLERLEMYLGAGRGGINAAATGFGSRVFFCFACGSFDTSLEDEFISILKSYDIPHTKTQREYEWEYKKR